MKKILPSLSLFLLVILLLSCHNQPGLHHNSSSSENRSVAWPEWYQPSSIDTLTVVTWNVENFADGYDDPYIDSRRENNPDPKLEKRRPMLAQALKKLDADLVVLQEFESSEYLRVYAGEYLPGMGYELFLGNESNNWYQNVVLMSRIPLGVMESYAGVTLGFDYPAEDQPDTTITEISSLISNRMWTVEVLANEEYRFFLSGLHLKAGRGARNQGWREAMMKVLRQELREEQQLHPQANFLVTRDLNTTPDYKDFRLMLGEGTDLEFHDLLAGTGAFSHPSDSLFWRLDHILPNSNMLPELVEGSAKVAKPLPMGEMEAISDHLPVVARFITRNR